jgi:hypothetical protein
MSRLLLLGLFCTSAIACTTANSPHTTTLAQAPAPVAQAPGPVAQATPVITQPAPIHDEVLLRDQLAIARANNLVRLEAYALGGAFPKNQVSPGLLNVFRDDEGHLCAVANLINLDGHTNLIDATAAGDNFIVLANVASGPLLDWILESGFTQEEIGMIQVPYMGEFEGRIPVDNGPVLAQIRETETDRIRAALLQVHSNISANTLASLALAVERANQEPIVAQLVTQRFSQPPR